MTDERIPRTGPVVVPPLPGEGAPGAVHEEERVGVLADGSVVREYDRVEEPPAGGTGNRWPWIISLVLLLILAGLGIWYFTRWTRRP